METRAPFVVVGAFVLAAIAAVFGFVFWLHNTGGLGPRASYHVQFDGSVPGLLVGAAVLFNGIRVGEVTDLGLAPDNPRRVNATISVSATTPVRSDTKVGLEFQGLTGVPVIALEGGTQLVNSGEVPTLIAEPFHVPLVMVPTVAISVPTNFAAAIEPASIALVTLPLPIAVTPPLVIVTSPDTATPVATFEPLPTKT